MYQLTSSEYEIYITSENVLVSIIKYKAFNIKINILTLIVFSIKKYVSYIINIIYVLYTFVSCRALYRKTKFGIYS